MSKPREFATCIDVHESQRINPVFDLAISSSLLSPSPAVLSIDGSRTLLHGSFLPFVIWAALYNEPFAERLLVHGYIKLPDDQKYSPKQFVEANGLDVLRYGLILASGSFEDYCFDHGAIIKARKIMNKVTNLAKYFGSVASDYVMTDATIDKLLDSANFAGAVRYFGDRIIEISRAISQANGSNKSYDEYLRLINSASVIFPATVKKAKAILSNSQAH